VTNVITRVRQPIDQALDRVVDWIVATARRLGRFVAQAGLPQDPNERLRLGLQAAVRAINALSGRAVTRVVIAPALALIRTRYGFTQLEAVIRNGIWWVEGRINPSGASPTQKQAQAEQPCECPSIEPRYTTIGDPVRPTAVEVCVQGGRTGLGSRHATGAGRPAWWQNLPPNVDWVRGHLYPEGGGGRGVAENLIAITTTANSQMGGADVILARARTTPGACLSYSATASYANATTLYPSRISITIQPNPGSTDNTTFSRTIDNYVASGAGQGCECSSIEPRYTTMSDPVRPTSVEVCVQGGRTDLGTRHATGAGRPAWWQNLPPNGDWVRGHLYPEGGGGRGVAENLIAITATANSQMGGADVILARARTTPGACLSYSATASYANATDLYPSYISITIHPNLGSTDNTTYSRRIRNY
jgi:hypothetical protein